MTEDLSDAPLYQLVNAFVAAVVDGEGDWNASVEALDKALDGKVERYQRAAHFIRGKKNALLGEGEYYERLTKTYFKRAQSLQAQDDRMEQALIQMMHATEKTTIETPIGTLKLSKLPHIELEEGAVNIMPVAYLRQPDPATNKEALLADFRAFKKALEVSMTEDEAIEAARNKMPPGVKVVYKESIRGF